MSKRLQVLLPDQEMNEIQRFARRERLTVKTRDGYYAGELPVGTPR